MNGSEHNSAKNDFVAENIIVRSQYNAQDEQNKTGGTNQKTGMGYIFFQCHELFNKIKKAIPITR